MRRLLLELWAWLVLVSLAPLIAFSGPRPGANTRVEEHYIQTRIIEPAPAYRESPGLARAWYSWFLAPRESPTRARLSVAMAWLMIGIAVAVLVGGGISPVAGAIALVALVCHPILQGLGALMTPWLPAAAFVLLALAFLQGMALPTIIVRRRSPAAWLPRVIATLGCGLAIGLAATAEPEMVWVALIPSFLFLLAFLSATIAHFRVRDRYPAERFMTHPWSFIRRTLPWAVCWFVVLTLFVEVYQLAGGDPINDDLRPLVPPSTSTEMVFAWASLPGILLLAWREGLRLTARSRLAGSSVLFASLVVFWMYGPALNANVAPLARLLAAPVFAASVAAWTPVVVGYYERRRQL